MTLEDLILFIDGEAIVIDKPAGLPVDPPRNGGPSVEARAFELSLGFKRPPTAMHRLDRDTSGCLLFARNPKARARFQQAFEAGTVEKTYIAVVVGETPGEAGTIDLPVAKVSSAAEGWRMVVDEGGKRAVTHWRRIAVEGGQSLVEFKPETGRTHQIRVHAARGLGAAIVGDPVYGSGDRPMLLHAWKLRVPRDPKPAIDVMAKIPDSFGLWLDMIDDH
ncbi:MAG: RNA pseudouridine synthase [Sphingomonas sp.]|uniref:RluA family pseudouridine synthase n=1 Tax=Sphingomonas sp. TaxID=28214 RepID=UPI0017D37368|nr:RNA pseudouridine synthase [Sphingomonas sp.]MBA3666524.1 RNA pseudouridine synthase [Sphingomonas sp.]